MLLLLLWLYIFYVRRLYDEFSISQSSDNVGMGFNADHSFVSIDSHRRKNLRGNERKKPTDGV